MRVHESDVSCGTLTGLLICLELLPQSIDVVFGFRCKVFHKLLHPLARGLAQILGTAESGGIQLHQPSVEVMLSYEQIQPIAKWVTVAPNRVGRLAGGSRWLGARAETADLFYRADANAIRLAQRSVDGASLGNPHLRTPHYHRDIARIRIAITCKAHALFRFECRRPKSPSRLSRYTEAGD